jgi:predicted ABC-type transport system involved in lysophospholipase L1 biosynthesis ATPase subunit
MVFQSYALYPHMTVYDNMAFGLENSGVAKAQIEAKVGAAATLLRLAELLKRKPTQLSGGQRQRVAIGRAIVREPKLFLFEPARECLCGRLQHGTVGADTPFEMVCNRQTTSPAATRSGLRCHLGICIISTRTACACRP